MNQQSMPPTGQQPEEPSPSTAAVPPFAATQLGFFDRIRSHGVYRGSDRWIGGVASGIAHRYGIDPLIVRGIFIVLTLFAGLGVLAYGVAWALLPEPDGRIHLQEAGAGRWTGGMTGALITTIIGFPNLGSGVWGWRDHGFAGFLWTLLWVGGAIYLVYYLVQRNKSQNGLAPMTTTPQTGATVHGSAPHGPAPTYGPGPAYGPAASDGAPPVYGPMPYSATPSDGAPPLYGPMPPYGTTPPSGPTPPYGGGYGGHPGGPAPTPRAPRVGPGTSTVAITAGAALLTGGLIKLLDVANVIDLGAAANAVAWASGAAVLGLGILFAGLSGKGSGLLGFLAVVALIPGALFSIAPSGDRFRFQDADWTPLTVAEASEGFDITGGKGTLDLTELNLSSPLASDVVIPVDATASDLTIVIPDTVPVRIDADMTMGSLNEGAARHGGNTTQQSSYNTEKSGAPMIVRIDGTMSNITIQEGN